MFLGGATLMLIVESNIVYWKIGSLSFSAYLTLFTPIIFFLFCATYFLLVGPKTRDQTEVVTVKDFMPGMLPWLALLLYGLISLLVVWRLEGFQNILALAVFILGVAVFALASPSLVGVFVERVFPLTGAAVGLLFILAQIIDTEVRWGIEFFSPRQYAMVATIVLSAAIASPRREFLVRLSPYVIFASILFSASRTAAVAGFTILVIGYLQREKVSSKKVAGLARLIGFALATFWLAAISARDVAERLGEGGSEQTNIFTDSGRLSAWQQFLGMPQNLQNWVFGLGSGASAEFGQANIPYFPQTLNEYLRFTIDNGIIGLSLFVTGVGFWLVHSKIWGARPLPSNLAAGLALVGLSLMSLTDGPFYSYFVVLPASVILGHHLRQQVRFRNTR